MTDLVKLEKNQPVTTSEIIAEGVKKAHHSVIKLVRDYKNDLEEFGTLELTVRKSGGRPIQFAYLNEPQTTFLITLMKNNEEVIKFKKKLVKEFYKMKKVLSEISVRQHNEEWQELRKTGKLTRKKQTDIIKVFIQYAIDQGSEGYKKENMIYSNFTKMENKALFLLQEKFNNIRQILTGQQLQILSSADQIVENALKEGMIEKMYYKDIFQMAKERVETFASLIPKTPVPMVEQKELIKKEMEALK